MGQLSSRRAPPPKPGRLAVRASAIGMTTIGVTRLIPATEAGVLGSAEVPFAILFAWTFLAELPPAPSIAGGALVLGAVVFHALRSRRSQPALPSG